jgi:tetraacyldisaccharide 4'-kinase
VVNGGRPMLDGALSMRLEAPSAVALLGGRVAPLDAIAGTAVHAVAGIGNPERFFNMLRSHGILVEGHPLADHARIGAKEVIFGDDRPVLMTEKDAVKCVGAADARHWYVPVTACFEASESLTLLNVVMNRIADRASPRRGNLDG